MLGGQQTDGSACQPIRGYNFDGLPSVLAFDYPGTPIKESCLSDCLSICLSVCLSVYPGHMSLADTILCCVVAKLCVGVSGRLHGVSKEDGLGLLFCFCLFVVLTGSLALYDS